MVDAFDIVIAAMILVFIVMPLGLWMWSDFRKLKRLRRAPGSPLLVDPKDCRHEDGNQWVADEELTRIVFFCDRCGTQSTVLVKGATP